MASRAGKIVRRTMLVGAAVLFAAIGKAEVGHVYSEAPATPFPDRHYLFYMHGAWPEQNGSEAEHPQHGRYQYAEIVQTFVAEGFEVISELRSQPVHPRSYAEQVAQQVKTLLAAGVPPQNISVAGHSKGGNMALVVAAEVGSSEVRYAVLAGCGKTGSSFRQSFDRFLMQMGNQLQGRILSLYDASDDVAGSCSEAFALGGAKVKSEEQVVHTGEGHGLFYKPQDVWIDPVVEWAKAK